MRFTSNTHSYLMSNLYAFQGMEKDDEISGSGNSIDFGNRMYDPRLGRFLSLDAFASKYPSISPYAFVVNNPISNLEIGGDSVLFYSASGKYLGYSNDNWRYKGKNLLVVIDDKNVKAFVKEYDRKRALKEVDGKKISDAYREAIVAGLEAMGTSVDVNDFWNFYDNHKDKGYDNEKMKEYDLKPGEPEVEWKVRLDFDFSNPLDKGGSMIALDKTAQSDNSPDGVSFFHNNKKGTGDAHTHTGALELHPSSPDKDRAKGVAEGVWSLIVSDGLMMLYRKNGAGFDKVIIDKEYFAKPAKN